MNQATKRRASKTTTMVPVSPSTLMPIVHSNLLMDHPMIFLMRWHFTFHTSYVCYGTFLIIHLINIPIKILFFIQPKILHSFLTISRKMSKFARSIFLIFLCAILFDAAFSRHSHSSHSSTDHCQCGHRCARYKLEHHCARCCTSVMRRRRSIPLFAAAALPHPDQFQEELKQKLN